MLTIFIFIEFHYNLNTVTSHKLKTEHNNIPDFKVKLIFFFRWFSTMYFNKHNSINEINIFSA